MFDSLKFHEKVDKCCKQRGTNITQMLKTLGLSTSFGTNWKNGRSPTADVVKSVAEYLEVSSDYLLSINVERTPLILNVSADFLLSDVDESADFLLSDADRTMLKLFKQLDEHEKDRYIGRLEAYLENRSDQT